MPKKKNPAAVALGKLSRSRQSKAQLRAHALFMVDARRKLSKLKRRADAIRTRPQ